MLFIQIATGIALVMWLATPMTLIMWLSAPRQGGLTASDYALFAALTFYPTVIGALYYWRGARFIGLSPALFFAATAIVPTLIGGGLLLLARDAASRG